MATENVPIFRQPDDPGDVSGPGGVWASGSAVKMRDHTNEAWIEVVDPPAPPVNTDNIQNSLLISGGQVVWIEEYTFLVAAAQYAIDGVNYSSPETTIVLDDADPALDRLDVIAVDTSSSVIKISGTAAAQASEPDVDPGTQLKLALISVPASTTEPVGIETITVYADNAGSPGEWTWTTSGSGFNVNSTSNPRAGTKDIEGTAVAVNAYAQGEADDPINPNIYNYLIFFIRSKANWGGTRGLTITLRNDGVQVGQPVSLRNAGTFGFDSTSTSGYQVVGIPTYLFAIPAGQVINQVRFTDFGGSIGFYIDDMSFQGNIVVSPTVSGEVDIPGLAGSADVRGKFGGTFSEEWDTTVPGLTWVSNPASGSPAVFNSNQTRPSHLYVRCDTDNVRYTGLRDYAPAGNFDIRLKLAGLGSDSNSNNPDYGIIIVDGTNPATWNGAAALVTLFRGGSVFRFTGYSIEAGVFTARTTNWDSSTGVFYLRITRTAGVLQWSISLNDDGWAWALFQTHALAFTPTKVGVTCWSPDAIPKHYYFDWLRIP